MTTPGEEMHALVERQYPLCRSITGDGVPVGTSCTVSGRYSPMMSSVARTPSPVMLRHSG